MYFELSICFTNEYLVCFSNIEKFLCSLGFWERLILIILQYLFTENVLQIVVSEHKTWNLISDF